jgi:hypothetical protein
MKKIFIGTEITVEQIADSVRSNLSDKDIVKLAMNFGEGGDCTYELLLLEKIVKVLLKVYPPKTIESEQEENLKRLMLGLEELLPLIKKEIT